MEAKTQRKICGAVLMLASSALGVDRWVFTGGPAAAQAAPSVVPAETVAAVTPAAKTVITITAAAADNVVARRTLAGRLQEAALVQRLQLADVQDAFRISSTMLPPPPKEPAPEAAHVNTAAEFAGKHRLTAVMTNSRGGMAMIDGRTYLPGQGIDGFTLTCVRADAAILENGPAHVELTIDKGTNKNP